jgi:hypothetical protein
MTDRTDAAVTGTARAPAARLEPNAISVAQCTIIGMASSAPAATVGLSPAALAAATAYGAGPVLLLTAIPMLGERGGAAPGCARPLRAGPAPRRPAREVA